jgi:ATP-binding cassette subfamily B protein RaxB
MSNDTLNNTDSIVLAGRKLPLIRQEAAAECGLACLAMIAYYYGYKTDIVELRRKFNISLRGADLASLSEVSSGIGFSNRALSLEVEELRNLKTPAILHWNFNHFVLLKKATKSYIIIHDPAKGVLKLSIKEVAKKFTGVALEITPTEEFKQKPPPPRLTLFRLVRLSNSFLSSFSLGV